VSTEVGQGHAFKKMKVKNIVSLESYIEIFKEIVVDFRQVIGEKTFNAPILIGFHNISSPVQMRSAT